MKAGDNNKAAILLTLETIFGADMVVTEHRFHPLRRWRFDYAVPAIKLAVEYHGHAGFQGRIASGHSTIKGLTNDCERINQAIAHGWRVLAFTALHFRQDGRLKHNLRTVHQSVMDALGAMQAERELLTTQKP